MNWDALGAIGEIVGALAVFVTLAYLAIQIRQNTGAVQASALDASVSGVIGVREKIIEDPVLTEIYLKGLDNPESLNDIDKARFTQFLHNIMWALLNVHSQASFATLSSDIWESQKPVVLRVFSSQGGKWFFDAHGHEFPESFSAEVRKILEK
jgi:hypothetical protein